MLISLRWLGRHIDLSGLDPKQIALDLTLSTAEVEGVEEFLPHARQIVIGRVLERAQHPGADRLSLCKVDVGQGEPLPIVCGASNVAAGQTVAVALPGTSIPGIGELKKTKIRGEVSLGMICSESEIGLSSESAGIWVLPDNLRVGSTLAEALELGDWVIDIDNKSLTHRPDLWGHRGIARELSAIYRRPLKPFEPALPRTGSGAGVPVALEDKACSRYLALAIDGAQPLPSPLWLRALLVAVGQRSLGQLVDLSNFVMLDLGQPNHVFDRQRLGNDGIVVRKAQRGQAFTALDGRTLELSDEDLLICSGGQGVALAGVIGGANSEVTGDTQRLLLEVATFDPATVRRTSVRHALRTDSSARFEKSLDPELPPVAAAHFASLLCSLQPGVSFPFNLTDVRTAPARKVEIGLDPERVRAALGSPLPDAQIRELLERLGFGVQAEGQRFRVAVPSIRATKDISIERDLVEEVGRSFGYGNIAERSLVAPVEPPPHDERRWLVRRIQDRLAGPARFTETMSYSFHSDELLEIVGMSQLPHATVDNPQVAQESRVRRSVAPSLLQNLEANRRHREVVRLFEIGKGYLPENANARHEPEERHLAAVLWAAPAPSGPVGFQQNALARLQGVVHDVLGVLDRPPFEWGPGEAPPWALSAGQSGARCISARHSGGAVVATLAVVSAEVLARLGLKGRLQSDVALGEISIDALLAVPRQTRKYVPLPKFPGIKVDVAVAVAESVPSATIVSVIRDAAGAVCKGVELFDVYQGEVIGAGKKSLAYHVLLQADDRTLSDTEEQRFLKRLDGKLEAIGAQLRDG
ncbi:MAG TPA: phenylalanine--tRNA ligase subunit beta [Polyangiaceae bacterium]|nr:phenylalanine--tRNA ligase subunit beta [Polyangiaceae bacterium]